MGVRQFTIALLVAAVSVSLIASSAEADFSAHDPDDTDAPDLDIRSVRSTMTPRHVLKFKARFYDVLNWHQNAQVRVLIDSRSGPSAEYALVAYRRADKSTAPTWHLGNQGASFTSG